MERWMYKGDPVMEVRTIPHGEGKLSTTVCISNDAGFRVASTIIEGKDEVVVVDTQWTLSNAHRVVAQILEMNKPLTKIFVTHAHPDHYFGTQVFTAAFPDCKVYALDYDIPIIEDQFLPKLDHWQEEIGFYNMASKPIHFEAYTDGCLDIDGQEIRVMPKRWGDLKWNSRVVIPSISTVICSDIVFSNAHPFTCEVPPMQGWDDWIAELETIRSEGYDVIVPGHAAANRPFDECGLDYTKAYLEATKKHYQAAKSNPDENARVAEFFQNMELDFFDSELRKSNEMNAAVLLGSREWNDEWNDNWDE